MPEAGGLWDQDELLIELMDICSAVYAIGRTQMRDWTAGQCELIAWMRKKE